MQTQRLKSLRHLLRTAVGQQETLKHEAEMERAGGQQCRKALERVIDEHAGLATTANRPAAVLGHAQRYGEWLEAEADRLRLETTKRQARLRELRASEIASAQRTRALERLIERLELAQICRQRRAEQDAVDHFALRQSQGRLS